MTLQRVVSTLLGVRSGRVADGANGGEPAGASGAPGPNGAGAPAKRVMDSAGGGAKSVGGEAVKPAGGEGVPGGAGGKPAEGSGVTPADASGVKPAGERVNGRFPSTAERRAAGDFAQADAMLLADLIRAMVEKTITPDRVSPERRRECVALMMEEGYTVHQAATAMQVHESTIKRDLAELRRERAMRPDTNMGNELFGDFFEHTMTAIQRMRKLAREEKAPAAVRLRTEEAVCKAYDRLLKSALAMRYVETGERQIARQREADEAEGVKRRMAEGSNMTAEMLGPKISALLGITPALKKKQPERDAIPGAGAVAGAGAGARAGTGADDGPCALEDEPGDVDDAEWEEEEEE